MLVTVGTGKQRSNSVVTTVLPQLFGPSFLSGVRLYLELHWKRWSRLNVFLALFLLISIVDGFSGFSPKRLVVSGYFKRTVKYEDIADITLINMQNQRKPLIVALFRTKDNKSYMMRFRNQVNEVVPAFKNIWAKMSQSKSNNYKIGDNIREKLCKVRNKRPCFFISSGVSKWDFFISSSKTWAIFSLKSLS